MKTVDIAVSYLGGNMYYEETANANPVVAIILGVVLLGENFNGTFLFGLGTLVIGVVFVNWPKKVHPE